MSEAAVDLPTNRSKQGLSLSEAVWSGNTSGWQAVDFKCFVLKDDVKETTDGGILLPSEARDKEAWNVETGILVSCGDQAFRSNLAVQRGIGKEPQPMKWQHRPEPGDRVMVREYTGQFFKGKDGRKYYVFTDKDIIGVMTNE